MNKYAVWLLLVLTLFVTGCETAPGWRRDPSGPNLARFGLYNHSIDIVNKTKLWIRLPLGHIIPPGGVFRGDLKKFAFHSEGGYITLDFQMLRQDGTEEETLSKSYWIPYQSDIFYVEEVVPKKERRSLW